MDQEKQEPTHANELLAEGKRCLAAGDVASAVENFQSLCSLLADQFGQLAKELAEPYYLYGKALLECARMESTVLGSGIPVPDDRCSSDEEEDDDDKEVDADATSSAPDSDGHTAAPQPSTSPKSIEESSSVHVHEGEGGGGKEGGGEAVGNGNGVVEAGPSGEGDEGQTGEEEETDLKLAWEVLELARVICQREDTDEYKLKLSDVYFTLGEVALESDQIDQAVGDMNSGLQLKELLLEPHERRLAEAHFNLGLAYSLQKDPQRSIQEYKCARNTLLKRKDKLMEDLKSKEEREQKEIFEEINDLESLLPDLDAKITDAEENAEPEEETTTIGFSDSTEDATTTVTATAGKAPISDISHLIRKRPADGNSEEDKETKRIRTEEPTMITPSTNGTTAPQLTSEQ